MNAAAGGFDALIAAARAAAIFFVVVFGVLALLDWAVRTRRISPFNSVARFFRSTVDPLIAPIERRVVRAGGSPTSAPWWALVFVVIAAIVAITLLDFLRVEFARAGYAIGAGPRGVMQLLVSWTIAFLRIAIIVRVLSSWLPVSPYSPWIRWSYLATEWFLRPLRNVIPTLGPIDITPIIAYFLLGLVGSFLVRLV